MKKLKYSPSSSDGSRSVSYRSRINPVLFPYRPSFFLLSPSFVVLSFSLPEAETIRKQYGNNMRSIYAGREDDTWWVHGENVVDVRTGRRSVEHAKHP